MKPLGVPCAAVDDDEDVSADSGWIHSKASISRKKPFFHVQLLYFVLGLTETRMILTIFTTVRSRIRPVLNSGVLVDIIS